MGARRGGIFLRMLNSITSSTREEKFHVSKQCIVLFICFRQNAHYIRRFSVPRVLRCPAGIDTGCYSRSFDALASILD